MKWSGFDSRKTKRGYALLLVLFFTAVGLMAVLTLLQRTASDEKMANRNNQYFNSVEAAEAATEKVMAELNADFLGQGAKTVAGKLPVYHTRIPEPAENAIWNKYQFKDNHNNLNTTEVDLIAPWATVPLISQYQGLFGYAATYRITSSAQDTENNVGGGVQQDVQLATIPVFQFAIFYNLDLEICPGPNMTISGRVHGNQNIYLQPQAQLTFLDDVTSVGNIAPNKSPSDPTIRVPGSITFDAGHDGGVNSLNLPIGTNNSPSAVHAILDIPPVNESPNSPMGQQRLYNNADLIVLVYDNQVVVHGGVANGNGPNLKWSDVSAFVNTNASFYNKRDGKTIQTTQIDVGQLDAWENTQNPLTQALGRDVDSIYVADLRSESSTTEPGVRLVNGQTLPPLGLTVATPDPLYVEGNYNVDPSALGTSDTSKSKPAALMADAITVLSTTWKDANSSQPLNSRSAGSTTVNAAFQAGIVPSGFGYYSGGVENFPRFLEDWSGHTFTYNGSMVVMFPSQIATTPWKGTGAGVGVYNPPTRNWNFDVNFRNPTKLPPITPALRTIIRGAWVSLAAQ